MLATGSNVTFEDVALNEVAQLSVESTSVIVNATAPVDVSSFVVWFVIAEITGASFTGITVNMNALVTGVVPSVTVKTIFEVPF